MEVAINIGVRVEGYWWVHHLDAEVYAVVEAEGGRLTIRCGRPYYLQHECSPEQVTEYLNRAHEAFSEAHPGVGWERVGAT